MRILYASFDEVPSFKGASTHILSSCRTLVREHELHLVTLGAVTLPRIHGLHHHPLPLIERNYLRRGMQFRERVANLAREVRPEVVHFRSPWEGLALIERGVPAIYEVNGLPSMELPQSYRDIPPSVIATLRAWEAQCLHAACAILCPSPRIRAHLLASHGEALASKIDVLPNGYDLAPHTHAPADEGALRMVYLGTLHPWQGLFRVLRGLAELGERVTLDLYAPPNRSWEPLLRKKLARYGLGERVRILPPLHRALLTTTLPTYHVGLAPLLKTERNTRQGCDPIKILDYLAHGLPVVAPDLFVARQALRHNYNGLLYEPDDVRAFVDAVNRLVDDRALLATLRSQAQPSLRDRLDWTAHSAHLARIYERIASA